MILSKGFGMPLFANLKIFQKLLIVVITVFFFLLLITVLSLKTLSGAASVSEAAIDKDNGSIALVLRAGEFANIFGRHRGVIRQFALADDKSEFAQAKTAYEASKAKVAEMAAQVSSNCGSNSECKKGIAEVVQAIAAYDNAIASDLITIGLNVVGNNMPESKVFMAVINGKLRPLGEAADARIQAFAERAQQEADQSLEQIIKSIHPGQLITIAVVAFVLGLLIAWYFGKSIVDGLNKLVSQANEIASGNLRVECEEGGSDEIGQLRNAMRNMVENLSNLIGRVRDNSGLLSENSGKMRELNSGVAVQTEKILEQALSVAAASEEMANTSEEIAKNCSDASESSSQAQANVQSGFEIVREIVGKIKEHTVRTNENSVIVAQLGEQTQQINGIISTIQEIAEQTNLLALNAAIEAARAGEHGRGFAVVADEVRSLAGRTSGSTKEISSMISAVQGMVEKATASMSENVAEMNNIAEDTGAIESSLKGINDSVDLVHQQITQIAAATEQQTSTSGEVSRNMQEISDATRLVSDEINNALAASDEIASASDSLSDAVKDFR